MRSDSGTLVSELRVLLDMPILSKEEMTLWDERAERLYRDMENSDFGLNRDQFSDIIRFINDSDIRSKDEQYKAMQEDAVRDIIKELINEA